MFFLFNSNYCFYSKEKEENVRGYCYDGMLLGDWIGEEGGFVKNIHIKTGDEDESVC